MRQPDGKHHGEKTTATVRDKGQREAGNRHDPDVHPDIDNRLKKDNGGDTGGDEPTKLILGAVGNVEEAPNDEQQHEDNERRTD